jgi:hypothetical protein
MVRIKVFLLGLLEQPRQNKNLLYWHDKTNKQTKERPLSFVLTESPFTSVSTVTRYTHLHLSLVSLVDLSAPVLVMIS